ncbi:hypothetical protein BWI17_17200 [Betaproteobacteria bacterium GR16-43]|nr:hypothetical protein BWI17_17200 [Betaproteobacteria bacterium GR16-43]
MPSPLPRSFLALLVAASLQAAVAADDPAFDVPQWKDTAPHKSGLVPANGTRLNVVDWGGTGPVLVMIHGIGDNPHVFDDLANALRGRFRVIAYARRGHGHSDSPEGPYTLPAYVEDLRGVMDQLKIPKAHLLGWAMGGNEITKFAGLYPARVNKLVYLEAGYDWSDPAFVNKFLAAASSLGPEPAELRSIVIFRNWYRTAWLGPDTPWTPGLESYLRDGVRFRSDGLVQPVPTDKVVEALVKSLTDPPRDYASVKAPALVLYATSFFPPAPERPEADAAMKEFNAFMASFRKGSRERIERELKGAVVKDVPDRNHMSIGVRDPQGLAKTIGEFLK